MKSDNIKKYLVFLAGVFFFLSCDKDPDHPPINEINLDAVMTVQEVRDLFDGEPAEITGEAILFANVVMDETTGNIYRSLMVQDETAGIELRLTRPSFMNTGDSLRIRLDGTVLESYQGMMQLNNVEPDRHIVKQAADLDIAPKLVSIPDIDPTMQAQLVRLEEVQFAFQDAGEPYAYAAEQRSENRTLLDGDGNSIIVRTSGYASFADEKTPEGSGSLIAVVSQFGDDMQLFLRTTGEVDMDGERFPPPGEDLDLMTIADVRQWFADGHSTLPPDSRVEGVVISDREYGNHPGQNAYIMDEAGDGIALRFRNWHSLNMGTIVRVIVSGIPVNEFNGLLQIEELPTGNAHVIDAGEVPEPTPVTIGELNDNFAPHESTLIRIEEVSVPSGGSFEGNIQVSDGTGSVNLYTYGWAEFADDPVEGGIYNITAIASFYHNPQLLIRSPHDMEYLGEDDNGDDDFEPVTSIDEDFQGFPDHDVIEGNGWTAIAEEGARKWICRVHAGNHYAQATAFNSSDPNNIMWMITPPVDLDAIQAPEFTFESAQAFHTHDGFGVYISTDFDGSDVVAASWEPLPANLADGGTPEHDWVPSGTIDLSGYSGVIHIAWRYEGNHPAGNTGSFRVNNVRLYDAAE